MRLRSLAKWLMPTPKRLKRRCGSNVLPVANTCSRRGAAFALLAIAQAIDRGLPAFAAEEAAGPVIFKLRLQFAQRIDFDLAHALAGQADFAADLLKRERLLAFKAESKLQHTRIALID